MFACSFVNFVFFIKVYSLILIHKFGNLYCSSNGKIACQKKTKTVYKMFSTDDTDIYITSVLDRGFCLMCNSGFVCAVSSSLFCNYVTFNRIIISHPSKYREVKYVPCITSFTGVFITFFIFENTFLIDGKESSKRYLFCSVHSVHLFIRISQFNQPKGRI